MDDVVKSEFNIERTGMRVLLIGCFQGLTDVDVQFIAALDGIDRI